MADTCALPWFCRVCGEDHACKLDAHHADEHRNRRHREIGLCFWDGTSRDRRGQPVSVRYPDPTEDRETLFDNEGEAYRVWRRVEKLASGKPAAGHKVGKKQAAHA